jgi:hypothetical protein
MKMKILKKKKGKKENWGVGELPAYNAAYCNIYVYSIV